MKLPITMIAAASLCFGLLVAPGCTDQTQSLSEPERAADIELERSADRAASNVRQFAEANWSLDAAPGAVRHHQRVDPATGKPIELSDAQRAASEYDDRSALEQVSAEESREANKGETTFGDPQAKLRAIR